jgi:Raf kinase inhibitor-like YbhB/YbcL family protein
MTLTIHSPAFAEGRAIPRRYTLDGENVSPPLEWSGAPRGVRSYALICEDPDAPSGTFVHWAVCNIPVGQNGLPEGAGAHTGADSRPEDGAQLSFAVNDFGHTRYDGPRPPKGHGPHHYHFRLAALDAELIDMPPDTAADELWSAVQPHLIEQAETVGTYQR